MIEMGLVKNWIKLHWPKSDLCASGAKVQANGASLGDLTGALLALNFGLLVSTLVFLLELLKGRKYRLALWLLRFVGSKCQK